jgi:hypothetical protein
MLLVSYLLNFSLLLSLLLRSVLSLEQLLNNGQSVQTLLCCFPIVALCCLCLPCATYSYLQLPCATCYCILAKNTLFIYIMTLSLLLSRQSIHQSIYSFYEPFLHSYTSRLTLSHNSSLSRASSSLLASFAV